MATQFSNASIVIKDLMGAVTEVQVCDATKDAKCTLAGIPKKFY